MTSIAFLSLLCTIGPSFGRSVHANNFTISPMGHSPHSLHSRHSQQSQHLQLSQKLQHSHHLQRSQHAQHSQTSSHSQKSQCTGSRKGKNSVSSEDPISIIAAVSAALNAATSVASAGVQLYRYLTNQDTVVVSIKLRKPIIVKELLLSDELHMEHLQEVDFEGTSLTSQIKFSYDGSLDIFDRQMLQLTFSDPKNPCSSEKMIVSLAPKANMTRVEIKGLLDVEIYRSQNKSEEDKLFESLSITEQQIVSFADNQFLIVKGEAEKNYEDIKLKNEEIKKLQKHLICKFPPKIFPPYAMFPGYSKELLKHMVFRLGGIGYEKYVFSEKQPVQSAPQAIQGWGQCHKKRKNDGKEGCMVEISVDPFQMKDLHAYSDTPNYRSGKYFDWGLKKLQLLSTVADEAYEKKILQLRSTDADKATDAYKAYQKENCK